MEHEHPSPTTDNALDGETAVDSPFTNTVSELNLRTTDLIVEGMVGHRNVELLSVVGCNVQQPGFRGNGPPRHTNRF